MNLGFRGWERNKLQVVLKKKQSIYTRKMRENSGFRAWFCFSQEKKKGRGKENQGAQ
jgi:hypothetical protein